MVYTDPKAAEGLIKAFGPTDDDKKRFAQTFLGSLVGQTVVLVGELVVYSMVVAGALKYYSTEGKEFKDTYGPWLFVLLAAPFIVILAFSIVPTVLRARRETRLKRAVISGALRFRPGYFRLTPYGKADRSVFRRLDGADDDIYNWLTSTQESLLYLSGASGVGKSSIMAAGAGPPLVDLGWTIIETRIFGEPAEHVRRTLLGTKGLFAREPAPEIGLRDLLVQAAESLKNKSGAPLLLIIDQFEEFLILNKAEQRAPFTAFLQELAAEPVDGLRLLLVYRSDYRALIFKLALPPPIFGKNYIEIAPYNRGEATEFLQGGGRRFSEEALDDLFRGLDRIEEARGIYRLVTLNMVGLILERMGRRIEEDPGRLFQRYLLECLSTGEGHEFARPLLENMITGAGTKEPQTESALVALTGLERWQVLSALTGLGAQGLVRRLEGDAPAWEISHDFLARTVGRLIGRLKPSLFRRAQPFMAPVALAIWIAFIGLFIPGWLQRNVEQRVMKVISLNHDNGVYIGKAKESQSDDDQLDDGQLSRLVPDLARLSGYLSLDLSGMKKVANIEPLRELKNLTSLNLWGTEVKDIDALKELTSLTSLDLADTPVEIIDALKELTSLTSLKLASTRVENIEPLRGLKNLTSLDLSAPHVKNIDALKELKSLESLELMGTQVKNIDALKELTSLKRLNLAGTQVDTLAPLRGFPIDIDGEIDGVSEELRATLK